jgi:hypothetical protein
MSENTTNNNVKTEVEENETELSEGADEMIEQA